MTKRILLFVGLLLLFPALLRAADEAIWIEGEDFTSSTYNQHTWYTSSGLDMAKLSAGDWAGHYTNGASTADATWNVAVTEGGAYHWWIRLNPFSNHYQYSIDGAAFQPLDVANVNNSNNLVVSGLDIRFVGWVYAGSLDLSAGSHAITVRITNGDGTHGGVDCMALVNFSWGPTGAIPPNPNPPTPAADDWFMLSYGWDPFSNQSIIDMSHLVEAPAGTHGALTRNGARFEFADGTPVRFWGVGARPAGSPEAQVRQAKFYRKHGINMVRQHPVQEFLGLLEDDGAGGRRLNPEKLDAWDRWFATLKENGIYVTWSLFFPHLITVDDGYPSELYDELPTRGSGKSTYGFVSLSPELMDAEWEWASYLLDHVNPYTGIAYSEDPALAIIECRNEDTLFWHWPLNALKDGDYPLHNARLKQRWQEWVKAEYGDDATLQAVWGSAFRADDSVDNVDMYTYGAWEMAADGWSLNTSVSSARIGDFIRFLAELQRASYEQRRTRLRAIGFSGVTVSTAWRAGGPSAVAANLWADDSMEAINRHKYFGGGAGSHSIVVGSVDNGTHLSQPGGGILSSAFFQVEDKPFMMTEWTQSPPNQWKAEIAPLMALYGMGLQGWDASYHFNSSRPMMGGGWPGLRADVTETPHYLAQFPALAFAIYNGHIEEGAIAAARRLPLNDIFRGIDALSQDFAGGGYDESAPTGSLDTPMEVVAIGRVTAKFQDGLPFSEKLDWDPYWNQSTGVLTSVTGQLEWDYANRVVTVRSDKTQGVIGFAGGGFYDLPGVAVDVQTGFVSLLFTPLDNRDLVDSEHILITALARDAQYGAQYNADGTQLLAVGEPPLMLEPVRATITVKGNPIEAVRVVDVHGVPTEATVPNVGNSFDIDGRYATYYYEVRRTDPPITHSIEVSVTAGEGTITPGGIVTVEDGGAVTFTIAPASGHEIVDVVVNGSSVGPLATYEMPNVTADGSVSASFQPVPEPATGGGSGGSIWSGCGGATVNYAWTAGLLAWFSLARLRGSVRRRSRDS